MTEGYHYTACGLDYVYLQNGFEVRETKHGEMVAIKDADKLHDAIAESVISSPLKLRGQEVRFLRSYLNLSQEGLARVLQNKRGSVARWEGEPNKAIPGPAEVALRMFVALMLGGNSVAEQMVQLLKELDDLQHGMSEHRTASFAETGDDWKAQPLAA